MKIEINNLSLKFADKYIFNGLSTTFNSGTINLIKGKNGAGKTCFLQCLCGVIPKHFQGVVEGGGDDSGFGIRNLELSHSRNCERSEAILSGEKENWVNNSELANFAYLMQEPDKQLCFPFIEEELFFGAENFCRDKDEFFSDYEELVQIFPILENQNKETSALSFGEKKVLLLCSQILKNSEIFLLDEPLAGLSELYRTKFIELIIKLKNKNKIIVIAEHTNMFDDIADQIIEL